MKTKTLLITLLCPFLLLSAFVLSLSFVLPEPARAQTTWDLGADFSDSSNPNGPWSYNAGNNPLPTYWPGWGWAVASPGSFGHIPKWNRAGPDVVDCHSADSCSGGQLANVTWTSPITGNVYLDFATWFANFDDPFQQGRSNSWRLYHGNVLLASGVVGDFYPFDSANPATYTARRSVAVGDIIRLEAAQHPSSPCGTFESFRLTLTLTEANQPPVATVDFYGLSQASSLSVLAPGVLANDSDPDNNPLTVELVTGPTYATSFQLNPDGSFTYTPPPYFYGDDTFTYRANDGTVTSDIATVHITVSQPGSAGFITGGGNFFQDGRRCTFGFVAKVQGNGVQGNLEFQDHDANMNVRSQVMQTVYAGSSIDGYFGGTCMVNGAAGYTFFVQIHDRGEPGRNDDLTIWIFNSSNNVVYTAGALLSGGNIVIHDHVVSPSPTPAPTATPTPTPSLRHWWCDNDGDGAYGDYGFSETAPFGTCTDVEPTFIDYCDGDPNATGSC